MPSGPVWFILHLILALGTLGILVFAGAQAFGIALMDRRLRHKTSLDLTTTAPSLQQLERVFVKTVGLGFVLLTILVGSSVLHYKSLVFGPALWAKTLVSLLAWVSFAVLLLGHRRVGWRGMTAFSWVWVGILMLVTSATLLV